MYIYVSGENISYLPADTIKADYAGVFPWRESLGLWECIVQALGWFRWRPDPGQVNHSPFLSVSLLLNLQNGREKKNSVQEGVGAVSYISRKWLFFSTVKSTQLSPSWGDSHRATANSWLMWDISLKHKGPSFCSSGACRGSLGGRALRCGTKEMLHDKSVNGRKGLFMLWKWGLFTEGPAHRAHKLWGKHLGLAAGRGCCKATEPGPADGSLGVVSSSAGYIPLLLQGVVLSLCSFNYLLPAQNNNKLLLPTVTCVL